LSGPSLHFFKGCGNGGGQRLLHGLPTAVNGNGGGNGGGGDKCAFELKDGHSTALGCAFELKDGDWNLGK
jgi:hypothetical protein